MTDLEKLIAYLDSNGISFERIRTPDDDYLVIKVWQARSNCKWFKPNSRRHYIHFWFENSKLDYTFIGGTYYRQGERSFHEF